MVPLSFVMLSLPRSGLTYVYEGSALSTDSYKVRLTRKPENNGNVVIRATSVKTGFNNSLVAAAEQVMFPDSTDVTKTTIDLTFTPTDYHIWKDVRVSAGVWCCDAANLLTGCFLFSPCAALFVRIVGTVHMYMKPRGGGGGGGEDLGTKRDMLIERYGELGLELQQSRVHDTPDIRQLTR